MMMAAGSENQDVILHVGSVEGSGSEDHISLWSILGIMHEVEGHPEDIYDELSKQYSSNELIVEPKAEQRVSLLGFRVPLWPLNGLTTERYSPGLRELFCFHPGNPLIPSPPVVKIEAADGRREESFTWADIPRELLPEHVHVLNLTHVNEPNQPAESIYARKKVHTYYEGMKEKVGWIFEFGGIQGYELELAKTNMGISSAGVTAFAALKLHDTEHKIKLPLAPLIIGFGVSFGASLMAVLLGIYYPRIGKAVEKFGTFTTAVTFSALICGLV